MTDFIQVCKPTVSEETIADLNDVLRSGWLGNGPKTHAFEEAFAEYTGFKYCVAMNSGTAALDLALKVYKIKGGELITTPMTFVSDALVGEWQGMDVTFADIDPDSLCLDPKSIQFSDKTKAVIAVDSHGRLADIKGIREQWDKQMGEHTLGIDNPCPLIIEDAAHACYVEGVGKDADITMWSFQAVKTLPTADGGALTTNDENIYKELRKLRWLGVEKSTWERATGRKYAWDYDITQGDGIKGYMNDVQATIAHGQLKRLDETSAHRRAIQSKYNEAFRDIKQIKTPQYSHTVQYYTMQCEDRDKLSEDLAEKGIVTSVHFKPLSEMTYWRKAVKRPIPVTDSVWKKLLTIPCHDALTWKQVEFIIKSVRDFYA